MQLKYFDVYVTQHILSLAYEMGFSSIHVMWSRGNDAVSTARDTTSMFIVDAAGILMCGANLRSKQGPVSKDSHLSEKIVTVAYAYQMQL